MATTDPLDALLYIRDGYPTGRWNFVDAVGTSINLPGGIGKPASVSFSFLTAVPDYYSTTGFSSFTEQQKQAAISAINGISDIVDIKFIAVDSGGDISFGFDNQNGPTGLGYAPAYRYSFGSNQIITKVTAMNIAGDVWLAGDYAWSANDFSPGGEGYATIIHEIGHALGLKHPFAAETGSQHILAENLNNQQFSIMSYTGHPHNQFRTVTQTPNSVSWQYQVIQPETLMPMDIAALQYLYGANTHAHTGNDTYTFDNQRPFIKTIWDAGGKDTLSVGNFTQACKLDLGAGHYSSITIPSDSLPPGTLDPNSNIYDGTDNLAIAYGCVIENAIGGNGNDQLIGNEVANVLDGGKGIDTMQGGLGNDSYLVDNISDIVVEQLGQGVDLIQSSVSLSLRDTDGKGSQGGNVENLTLIGKSAINGIGNVLNNYLTGNNAANHLDGDAGKDQLKGGLGADLLTGGIGADRFIFLKAGDSGINKAGRDTITDFNHDEGDKIDLSAIDANASLPGNNAFSSLLQGGLFAGSFSQVASLYFDQTSNILYGNNDVDNQADFSIKLTGVSNLLIGDLLL